MLTAKFEHAQVCMSAKVIEWSTIGGNSLTYEKISVNINLKFGSRNII